MKKRIIPSTKTLEAMEKLLNVASDYTRLKILYTLIDGEKNVSEIQEIADASQSLVSHQLKVLRDNNLVNYRKDGTRVVYFLSDEHVREIIQVVYDHVTEK
ncbi:MAG: metalloregulator ArsR/SmtB family transcription factor [Firmicutes bacterium]|nr:metalloregulator ArsR/SmtB family transcription factor [Bacillota bacterium]